MICTVIIEVKYPEYVLISPSDQYKGICEYYHVGCLKYLYKRLLQMVNYILSAIVNSLLLFTCVLTINSKSLTYFIVLVLVSIIKALLAIYLQIKYQKLSTCYLTVLLEKFNFALNTP